MREKAGILARLLVGMGALFVLLVIAFGVAATVLTLMVLIFIGGQGN